MSAPILYTVQSGETLQDIATKLGIKDWTKLQDYHNAQAAPDQKTSVMPYAGFKLMTPSKEEIYTMNGETLPPDPVEEQNNARQTQEEEKKKEAEEKKNEQASKSDHDGKYFIVHNAKCSCDQSVVAKQPAKLQVTSHSIIILNDQQDKLAATELDRSFDPAMATFGKCKMKPMPGGGYMDCTVAPAPKWGKTYDSTQVMGKNTLTEISELQCMTGGKITILNHGQTDAVTNAHADNTNPVELAMVNPAVEPPKKKEEYPVVTSISLTEVEDRPNFEKLDSKNKSEVVYLRRYEEVSFKANLKSGNKQLTSWMIYSDHQGKKENRLFLREQIGPEFSQSFADLGKFRIEGYGKPKKAEFENGKYDKCDPTCSIDVEVVQNTLLDIECTSADFTSRIDPSKNRKFRKGVPSVFKAKFFIANLTEEEKSRLTWAVEDGAGNTISEGVRISGNTLTFTPVNSKAKYTIIAKYTNENGEAIEKKIAGETEGNAVLGISHGAEVVRPGTSMSFSVAKMKYKFGENDSPYGLTSEESSQIKWNLNGVLIGTGKSITIPGSSLMTPGKYVVEAYSMTANATGKNAKDEEDDWRFEVKENDVVSFTLTGTPKLGKPITATVDKMVFADLLPGEIIHWNAGSAKGTGKSITITPKIKGALSVSCKINNRKGIRQEVTVVEAKITKGFWNDFGGSEISQGAWGQKVDFCVKGENIEGEEIELAIYDSDNVSGDDLGYSNTENKIKITGKNDKTYASHRIELSPKMKTRTTNSLSSEAKLYGKARLLGFEKSVLVDITPLEKTSKYLTVNDDKTVYRAIIGDQNGRARHNPVDYDIISWTYANTTYPKGTKLIVKIFEDIDWSIDKECKELQMTGTVGEDGTLVTAINWGKLKDAKQNKKTKKYYAIIYDEKENKLLDGSSSQTVCNTILIPQSTLVKQASYTGAVTVGSEQVSQQMNGTCVCKDTNLIWGGHKAINCDFRKKIIDISKRQNFDPNDLMAVMKVETSGTFSASKIELKETKEKRRDGKFKKEYRGLTKDEILQLSENFAGAVGLIQFTPVAIKSLNTNYNLSLTKRKLALMSQLEQLDYVEKYIELWKKAKNITGKISLSDLYVLVFAPNYFGSSDDTTLYKEGSDYYNENASVDTDGKNGITKNEIAARAISAKSEGAAYKVSKFSCGNTDNSNNNVNAKEIVTFRIYADGKIEKHIPKIIKEEYKEKYKYVYHDKEGKEHDICIANWHTTSKKLPSRSKIYKKPTHSKVISDENVNEGQTKRRVIYENGDIAEYGSNRGDSFWRLYSATKETIELVEMPETVKYINYSFSGTKRKYTGPNCFAGFIGALANTGLSISTTGSCFREGSCFPSQFHVNGESVDTIYFWKLETDQKFIDAMKFFHFGERRVGNDAYFKKLKDVLDGGDLHDTHLHSGEFDNSKVIEIKEK